MHRVDRLGNFSQLPYPKKLGDQTKNHFLKNDFVETESEMITPAHTRVAHLMSELKVLNDTLRATLDPAELLWPLSMPPRLPKGRQLTIDKVDPAGYAYRQEVVRRHGFARGVITGVHVNVGFSEPALKKVYNQTLHGNESFVAFKNHVYLRLAQEFLEYRWLLTYLFGASPVAEANYFQHSKGPKHPVRSLRSSSYGFGNGSFALGDYRSAEDYVAHIERQVQEHKLIAPREFYGAVRLKGVKLDELTTKGIGYVELRMFDLNPFTALGVDEDCVVLVKLMAQYFFQCAQLPLAAIPAHLKAAANKNEAVSLERPTQPLTYAQEAQQFLAKLTEFAKRYQATAALKVLNSLKERVTYPSETYAARLLSCVQSGSLTPFAIATAKRYQRHLQPHQKFMSHYTDATLVTARGN